MGGEVLSRIVPNAETVIVHSDMRCTLLCIAYPAKLAGIPPASVYYLSVILNSVPRELTSLSVIGISSCCGDTTVGSVMVAFAPTSPSMP